MKNNFHDYKFSELYDINSGISSTKEQAGHGAPFVTFSDVFNNYFLPDTLSQKMDTSVKEQEKCSVKEGDIFLTRTSETLDELAMSSVAVKNYPHATFSGFLKRLRPKKKNVTYAKYMAFYLRGQYFRKIIDNNATMTLRASFNEDIFSWLHLLLPSYNEQKKIGDWLFSIEQKMQLNNKMNATLEAMAKTLYDYWFVQFDFPDEYGRPYKTSGGSMTYNKELGREIPTGWDVTTIGNILGKYPRTESILRDSYQEGNTYPIIDQSQKFICGYTDCKEFVLHLKDAIVFGDHTDISKYVNFDFARGADGTQIITSAIRRLPNYLLYMQINSLPTIEKGYSRHFKFLKQQNIFIPCQEISDLYTDKVTPMLQKKREILQENHRLTSLRDFLLPLLMNGQVTFK